MDESGMITTDSLKQARLTALRVIAEAERAGTVPHCMPFYPAFVVRFVNQYLKLESVVSGGRNVGQA